MSEGRKLGQIMVSKPDQALESCRSFDLEDKGDISLSIF